MTALEHYIISWLHYGKPPVATIPFPDATIMALRDLGDVLKSIHLRMKSEGYDIIDGKVQKINE